MSGTKREQTNSIAFDLLYGGHHRFLGHIDVFTKTPQFGLTDLNIKVKYQFTKKIDLRITYHMFLAIEKITYIDSKSYGSEVDFECSPKLAKDVILKLGDSFYQPTDGLRTIKEIDMDADFLQFGYAIMLFTLLRAE